MIYSRSCLGQTPSYKSIFGNKKALFIGAALITLGAYITPSSKAQAASGVVKVYSYRQPALINPLLKAFEKRTGINVEIVFNSKGAIERVAAEGKNSEADLILTVDIGRLTTAVSKGVSQPVKSDILNKNIPAAYRDSAGHWFGLTRRARVLYVSKERVTDANLTYEDLANTKYRGKICIRSGQHVYNVALIASMIAHLGEAKAEQWLKGVKKNLSRKPSGNDRLQVKGVYTGECDIALANTYYMAKMMLNEKDPKQKDWARSVRIVFPNTKTRGTHVNISGMALAKYAPNKANAIALMEYLSSEEAQRIYAEVNHEYPVKEGIAWSKLVKSWGAFKADKLELEAISKLRKKASELVDKVQFNDGPSS